MAYAGRKRKHGPRYPSGDRVKVVRQDEVRRVALEARMRVFGVSSELASRDVMGSPLGRLLHWNMITPAQADAGFEFSQVMRFYLSAAGLNRPNTKSNIVPTEKGSTAFLSETMRGEAKGRRFMEALREVDALDPASPSATSIVWDVCISENDRMRDRELGLLRAGLNAISRLTHRGIVADRKSQ